MSLSYNVPKTESPFESPETGLVSLNQYPVLNPAIKNVAYAQVSFFHNINLDAVTFFVLTG